MKVAIAGAGGHGKVVADALIAEGRYHLVGFLDDDPCRQQQSIWGFPVLGDISGWSRHDLDALVVAVGDNARRKRLFEGLRDDGARFVSPCHPAAILGKGVVVGSGVVMLGQCVVNADSVLGDNIILNTASTVDHDCRIGSHAHLAPGVHLGGGVCVEEGAFLGIGAVVLPGITIGAWATVGAGAVVVRDVADHATIVGVPGRER